MMMASTILDLELAQSAGRLSIGRMRLLLILQVCWRRGSGLRPDAALRTVPV